MSQPVKLKLSTMTAIDTIIASKSVHGLQVRGLHSESRIQLQQAYSRDFIPVDKSYVPTKETALLWPHLRSLADKLPPLQDCDVGLLIGYNCPAALAPCEVILGDKNQPVRTEIRTRMEYNRLIKPPPRQTRKSELLCIDSQ